MKYQQKDCTGNEGVLHVAGIVNDHGSIFRPIPQETDVGVDGYIELIAGESSTGKLVAVQIKSGKTYVAEPGDKFTIYVDQEHIDYWCNYLIPVILVGYCPERKLAAWIPVGEYVRYETYHDRTPIKKFDIPFSKTFDVNALNGGIAGLASADADRRALIDCVDLCLDPDSNMRMEGLTILTSHPDSRDAKTTAFVCRHFLFDSDPKIAELAIHTLAYHACRQRWTWNPNNKDENAIVRYASKLCQTLSPSECRQLIERTDGESFHGPEARGERILDILLSCDASHAVFEEIAADNQQPMERRTNSLYMMYGCDDVDLIDYVEVRDDPVIGDVYKQLMANIGHEL